MLQFKDTGIVLVTAELVRGIDSRKRTFAFPDFNAYERIIPASPKDDDKFEPHFLGFDFELRKDQLQIRHYGVTELFMSKDPITVEFPFELNGEFFVGCSAESEANPVCIIDLQLRDEEPEAIREHFKKIVEQPQSQLKARLLETPSEADPLPLCVEAQGLGYPLELCPLLNQAEHRSKFRHVCRFGKSCKMLQPSHKDHLEHHRQYSHKDLEDCKFGSKCRHIDDPLHRAQFHHEELHDWISLCHGKCAQAHKEDHVRNYFHGEEEDKYVTALR